MNFVWCYPQPCLDKSPAVLFFQDLTTTMLLFYCDWVSAGKYTVQVMLVSFLELRDVPFILHACSELCQETIKVNLVKQNQELQRKLDEEYEKSIQDAQKLVDENKVDISPATINAPEGQVYHFTDPNYRASDLVHSLRARQRATHRRRKKCIVM